MPEPLHERRDFIWVALAVVAAAAAGIHAIGPWPVGALRDDAHYVILAKAIATGQGYRNLNLPGAPEATHFPPAYPLFLAALWRLMPRFPENIALFRMANVVFLAVTAFFTVKLARERLHLPGWLALVAALAGTVTIPALVLGSNVMSEPLFLALLLPLLLRLDRGADTPDQADGGTSGGTRTRDVREAVLAGLAAGALCLVRTHAIALVGAIVLTYALQRRFRHAAFALAASLALMLPWMAWVRLHDAQLPAPIGGRYDSYLGWWIQGIRDNGVMLVVHSAWQNVLTVRAIIARSFSPVENAIVDWVAVISGLALLVPGALVFARRLPRTSLFILLYLGIVMLWPFSPLRFVWGIWPLLMLMVAAGARRLWSGWPQRRAVRVAGLAAAAVAVSGILSFNVRGYMFSWWYSRPMAERIRPQLRWVADHTVPTDLVISDDEGAVYLYTGRRAAPPSNFLPVQYLRDATPAKNAADLARIVRYFRPQYVIAWVTPTIDAAEAVARETSLLTRTDTIPGGFVYRGGTTGAAAR